MCVHQSGNGIEIEENKRRSRSRIWLSKYVDGCNHIAYICTCIKISYVYRFSIFYVVWRDRRLKNVRFSLRKQRHGSSSSSKYRKNERKKGPNGFRLIKILPFGAFANKTQIDFPFIRFSFCLSLFLAVTAHNFPCRSRNKRKMQLEQNRSKKIRKNLSVHFQTACYGCVVFDKVSTSTYCTLYINGGGEPFSAVSVVTYLTHECALLTAADVLFSFHFISH